MFEKIIKQAEKNGLTAIEKEFKTGYYFDGKDNGYIYPVIVFTCDSKVNGKDLSSWLNDVLQIAKRHKLVKRDSSMLPGHYYMAYTTIEHNNKATYAYGKSVCFQEGFFMERYNNRNATEQQLITAGHNSLLKHGYTI